MSVDVMMTDKQLVRFTTEFRSGIVRGRSSEACCFMVCWPLASLLSLHGVEAECIEVDLSGEPSSDAANHVWLKLSDGRALDPTIDQFNSSERKFPKVYLGQPVPGIHIVELGR